MDENQYFLDGYAFDSKEMYNLSLREQRNIHSIKSKLNMQEKASVLTVYKKLVTHHLLVTPVGIEFERELRNRLITEFQVDPTELPMIHIPKQQEVSGFSKKDFTREQLLKDNAKKGQRIKTLSIIIVGLLIIIIGMFVINTLNPNTGYVNYENKILNKYSSWEEELNQREAAIKEQEAKLGITESEEK